MSETTHTHYCTLCERPFSTSEAAAPRCPQCLKKSGVIAQGDPLPGAVDRSGTPIVRGPGLWIGLAVVAIVGGGSAAWWFLTRPTVDAPAAVEEGPAAQARAALEAAGAPPDTPLCFEVDDAVRALAGSLAVPYAGALAESLLAAQRQGRFEREPHGDVDLEGPPRTAAALAGAINRGEAPTLTAVELGCLGWALARAAGLEVTPAVATATPNSGTAVRRKSFGLLSDDRFFDLGAGVSDAASRAQPLRPSELVAYTLALRAAWHLQRHEHAEAARDASFAASLLPGEPALLALGGQIQVASGMPEFGIEEIAKAVAARPDALGWYNLGMAHAMADSPFKAYQALLKATELDAGFAAGWMGLGNLELERALSLEESAREAKLGEVEAHFDKAGTLEPGLEGLRTSRAQLALVRGDRDAAIELLREAVRERPDRPDPRLMLGQLMLEAEDAEAAVEHLERAAVALAGQARARQARALLTVALSSLEDWDRAEAISRRLLEAEPGADDIRLMLAGALREAGEIARAKAVLSEQREAFPDDPFAPLLLAQLALDDGEPERAIELARASRRAKPSFEGLIVELLGQFRAGRPDEGLALVEDEARRRGNARVQAAQALLEAAEVEPAIAVLRVAVDKEPDRVEVAVLLYMAHLVLGQTDAAAQVRSAALERAPERVRDEWAQKLDEGKREVDAMVRQAPAAARPGAAATDDDDDDDDHDDDDDDDDDDDEVSP